MRIKSIMTVILAGFLNLTANAGFEQFNNPIGGMNVFEPVGGAYEFSIVPFGLSDLRAITADDRTFELLPNINLYADNPGSAVWRNNGGAGPDGNRILEANTLFEMPSLKADITSVVFDFDVSAFDLDTARYELVGFVKVLNPSTGYSQTDGFDIVITAPGTNQIVLGISPSYAGQLLQAGWTLRGLNANPTSNWGSATVTATALYATSDDFTAPTPDPMGFAVAPDPVSDIAISMTASNATDSIYGGYGVEYLFTNTFNNTSSGWQSSPTWVDRGPSAGFVVSEMPIVNHDFASGGTGWSFDSNSGWGDTSESGLTTDGGNNVAYAFVNGTEDNGNGGYAVIVQPVDLDSTDFVPGDTVTLSADIRALTGQNGGGALLKMESWGGGVNLGADLEVILAGTTTSWANYSIDYTIAAGADEVRVVLGTSTGWSGVNAADSHYLFDNVVVDGLVEVFTGLTPGTMYTYQVKARDTSINANETGWSSSASASTLPLDTDSPLPNTMIFDSTDSSPLTVKLTATTATDPSGSDVEYYFTSTAGGGNDSGWQSSPIYYDTDLNPGSSYSYTVIARDLSAAQNSNTVSSVTSISTMSVVSGGYTNTLTGYAGNNTDDPDFLFALEKAGLTTGSSNPGATIDFSASGATFGDGLGATGRNLLKTIASDYGSVSFEAYATLTFSGAADLSGYIGMGQGLQTGVPNNYGVPELNLGGVNGVVAEFKDNDVGSSTTNCTLFKFIGGNPDPGAGGDSILSDPVGSTETVRARLIYDATAETVNVSIDKNYTGGAFVADQDMGTVSTTNGVGSMWDGQPVRVYAGGGEGTIVKDFEIVVTSAAQPPFNVQIASAVGGEAVLVWQGAAGRIYDVQYRSSLTSGSWSTDPVASDIASSGGTMTATSSVSGVTMFYQVLSK